MKKHSRQRFLKFVFVFIILGGTIACSTPKYAYHSAYKLTGCAQPVSREKVTQWMVRRGYLRSSDPRGPYEIFHRPNIIKKGRLAQEPYEDKSGDIAVAVCAAGPENYVLTEEWRGCGDSASSKKDCTAEDQIIFRQLASDWSCKLSERSGRSPSWKLEDRQDWTQESCSFIATNLIF